MSIKKITLLQTAFLGDAILLAPMIEALHQKYGNNLQLTLILKKGLEELFNNDPRIHSIISFDKRGCHKGLIGLIKFIKIIRKNKTHILINVHRSWRSGLVTIFSGALVKIGFKEAGFSFLFDKTIKRTGSHEVFKNHKLLTLLDSSFINNKPDINNAYKLNVDCSNNKDNKTIIIAPGSRWHTKKWTLQGFIDLSNLIISKTAYKLIFTGDNNDLEFVDKIVNGITDKTKITNLCGKLSLKELFCNIKNSSMVITNDSAPQHIAVGFNIPVIAIFGPTTKDLGYYPFSNKAIVVENNDIKCRPCGKHGHMECPNNTHKCMNSISADMVFNQFIISGNKIGL